MDMQSSDHDLENDLAKLLSDLATIQGELLEVLTDKRNQMVAGNLEAIRELHKREENLANRLKACHDRRGELLQSAVEKGLPGESISELSKAIPGGNRVKLQKHAKETAARMRLLQHQSLANWVLAQRSLLHISQLLEIIATGGQIQPTYGDGKPVLSRGALVDREV